MTTDALRIVGVSFLIIVALYPAELLFPAEKGQHIWKRLYNLLYLPVVIGFACAVQPLADRLAGYAISHKTWLTAVFAAPGGLVPTVLISFLFALLWDVWQYWVHRLQHTSDLLWPTHRFHHSETALNASTAARSHVGNHILFLLLWIPVVALLGAIAPHWLAAFVMFRLWGHFIHANIKLNIGFLTPVITGPQFHRIHHSNRLEHKDKNFATLFPIIDIVFGTYYRPAPDEFPETGLIDGDEVTFIEDASIQPFRMWGAMFQAAFKLRNRVPSPTATS